MLGWENAAVNSGHESKEGGGAEWSEGSRIESMYVGSYEVIGCTGSKSVKRESNVGMQNSELKVRCGSTGKFLPEDNYYL